MSKATRGVPFTPMKRPLSQASTRTDDTSTSSTGPPPSIARFPSTIRAPTPLGLASPPKRIRSAISSESRPRSTIGNYTRPTSTVGNAPGTPKKTGTPRRNGIDASYNASSITDIPSDPEEGLVDFQNVEVDADVSFDGEDVFTAEGRTRLSFGTEAYKDDKVLVSIRIRPSDQTLAWDVSVSPEPLIKLKSEFSRNGAAVSQEFKFDNIIGPSTMSKSVYASTAKNHVRAAMDGYNAVVFAYGQTASGKTFTLTGNEEEPGIIPRAMRDVFGYIKHMPSREFLLRCSYLEIYNETIHDLLSHSGAPVGLQGGVGNQVIIHPLREEVVTSLKSVKEVIQRGEANRRTASTDWNERSSRSHSVFRLVVESRERGSNHDEEEKKVNVVPQTPGGSRLQARGGRSVRTSVLSLIDLAGSEKATSDKERTREGKYINTSLLTLGSVIGTLAENHAKGKSDHIPYRNSKLTRLLQPSLSGDARISVICTLNPDSGAVAESTSTLLFAQRVKKVHLCATKKEVIDTDALIERYRKEIEELRRRLEERERDAPVRNRRLSAREQVDESRAMGDLNARIKQLTKLILTSQTVDDTNGDKSRPSSPSKLDFDLSPYQLQQELLAARREIDSQATQILSLEAALDSRPEISADAPDSDKDRMLVDQARTIKELELVIRGYEDNLGEPLRAVREDVEKEWKIKVDTERKTREEKEEWANELVRQLEREKQVRQKLEDEKRALISFVTDIDNHISSGPSRLSKLMPPSSSSKLGLSSKANTPLSATQSFRKRSLSLGGGVDDPTNSPVKTELSKIRAQPSLLEQMPEEEWEGDEPSFRVFNQRSVSDDKENIPARS
ncbi:kinesin-domain-containing protein [Hysterangium stoloniferum]|nr:kinesin-domain-containing protein [Hysterangium stoloniferum]